ncbi:TadE family protein [Thiocapsa roseopersicina]|nr:TadE family protein [Thiocapsa roseopersicina]
MVQLAILTPIALAVLLGIVEISVGFFNQAILTNASRAAAREAIRVPEPRVDPVTAALDAFNGARIDWNGSGDLGEDDVVVTPVGSQVTVTLTYPHRFLFLPSFADGIVNINLVARTDMRMRR